MLSKNGKRGLSFELLENREMMAGDAAAAMAGFADAPIKDNPIEIVQTDQAVKEYSLGSSAADAKGVSGMDLGSERLHTVDELFAGMGKGVSGMDLGSER